MKTMNRLLIVDDALIMRMKIRDIARSAGWEVVAEAANGEEAVRLFQEHRPDLVTLDMVMPGVDGALDFIVKPFDPAGLKAFFEQQRQST